MALKISCLTVTYAEIIGFYYVHRPLTHRSTDQLTTDQLTHRPKNHRLTDKIMFNRNEKMKTFILQNASTGEKMENYTSAYNLFE